MGFKNKTNHTNKNMLSKSMSRPLCSRGPVNSTSYWVTGWGKTPKKRDSTRCFRYSALKFESLHSFFVFFKTDFSFCSPGWPWSNLPASAKKTAHFPTSVSKQAPWNYRNGKYALQWNCSTHFIKSPQFKIRAHLTLLYNGCMIFKKC